MARELRLQPENWTYGQPLNPVRETVTNDVMLKDQPYGTEHLFAWSAGHLGTWGAQALDGLSRACS